MVAISQTTFSNAFFMNETFCILSQISLKFVSKGPIDSNPALGGDELKAVHVHMCHL